jgi:hypothetical protein
MKFDGSLGIAVMESWICWFEFASANSNQHIQDSIKAEIRMVLVHPKGTREDCECPGKVPESS